VGDHLADQKGLLTGRTRTGANGLEVQLAYASGATHWVSLCSPSKHDRKARQHDAWAREKAERAFAQLQKPDFTWSGKQTDGEE
jgi:hypothetical protein